MSAHVAPMLRRVAYVLRSHARALASGDDGADDVARAVLLALREPTKVMVSAGAEYHMYERGARCDAAVRDGWRAMIDAALGET